ncbi:MAG: hypothetical protein E2O73_01155 [Deltaproteobacteria bacterium]|nr:MAG: hypothetical protein E2O73_01155 [Deltaproteobacteria bacterium]
MQRRFQDIELGDELPEYAPDISLSAVRSFAEAVGVGRVGRFTDHEQARREGLPGAIVPGIMSQGILAAMIHKWAPGCQIRKLDTVFRAPIVVDSQARCRGVITETEPDASSVDIDLTIVNEAGETRVLGTATVRI